MKTTQLLRCRTPVAFVTAIVLAIFCCATAVPPARATPPPTISGFSPQSGPVGTTVVINGANFAPPITITFAGNAPAAGSFTSTKITCTVPFDAQSGPIQVQTAAGTAETATPYVVGPSDEPKATLDVTIPTVKEGSGKIGEFMVHLSKAATKDTVVKYGIKGTAVNGTEYKLLLGTVTIKAGALDKPIKIVPKGNLGGAPDKTVKLHLEDGAGYKVGRAAPKVVTILPKN